jgi:hypothetical protein
VAVDGPCAHASRNTSGQEPHRVRIFISSHPFFGNALARARDISDQTMEVIKYNDFVNRELILFSMADLSRSIPSMVDGLKPSQRKILFCAFKRNFVTQAKVA